MFVVFVMRMEYVLLTRARKNQCNKITKWEKYYIILNYVIKEMYSEEQQGKDDHRKPCGNTYFHPCTIYAHIHSN